MTGRFETAQEKFHFGRFFLVSDPERFEKGGHPVIPVTRPQNFRPGLQTGTNRTEIAFRVD